MRYRLPYMLLLVSALLCLPISQPGAQEPSKVHKIGHLLVGTPTPQWAHLWDALRRLGYAEGHNLIIERRYPPIPQQLADSAADLVGQKVNSSKRGVPQRRSPSKPPRQFRLSLALVPIRCSKAWFRVMSGQVQTLPASLRAWLPTKNWKF